MQIFLSALNDVPDPRASNARHDLGELLVIAFVSVLCGSSSCAEMAAFGRAKESFFRGFLKLKRSPLTTPNGLILCMKSTFSVAIDCRVLYDFSRNLAISGEAMKAKPKGPEQDDLFRARLVEIIDMRHELVKLAALIDWEFFEREWAGFFPSEAGRPATPSRLVAVLLYLQHAYQLSDEAVVARWVENPYYQHFCGETARRENDSPDHFLALLTPAPPAH